MTDIPEARAFITPGAIVAALLSFFMGAASMAYNPFFATSVIAVGLSILTLRSALHVEHNVVQGVLRILAIIGIMGGLAGVSVLMLPNVGLPA